MLLGTFKGLRLTAKGIQVPPPLRPALELGFVITRGLDRCAVVFPHKTWTGVLERIEEGPSFLAPSGRLLQRHIYGGASSDCLDPDGRMSVPEDLRIYAGLDSEVVVVGVGTRMEIWNPERWTEVESRTLDQGEQVSEALSEYWIQRT